MVFSVLFPVSARVFLSRRGGRPAFGKSRKLDGSFRVTTDPLPCPRAGFLESLLDVLRIHCFSRAVEIVFLEEPANDGLQRPRPTAAGQFLIEELPHQIPL